MFIIYEMKHKNTRIFMFITVLVSSLQFVNDCPCGIIFNKYYLESINTL